MGRYNYVMHKLFNIWISQYHNFENNNNQIRNKTYFITFFYTRPGTNYHTIQFGKIYLISFTLYKIYNVYDISNAEI